MTSPSRELPPRVKRALHRVSPHRHTWARAGKFLLAGVCLALLVRYIWLNKEDLSAVRRVRPAYMALIMTGIILNMILEANQFLAVLRLTGARIAFWPWMRIFVISRFLSRLAPQSGNLYRATVLKTRFKVRVTNYVSVLASVNLLNNFWGLLFALGMLLWTEPMLRIEGQPVWLFLLGALALVGAAPFLLEAALTPLEGRTALLDRLHEKLVQVVRGIRTNVADTGLLIEFAVYASLQFAVTLGVVYYCFACLGIFLSLSYVAVCTAALKLSRLIVLTPGNIGIVEFVYGWLSYQAGYDPTEGVLAALILRALVSINLTVFAAALGGFPYLFKSRRVTATSAGNEDP